MTDPDLVDIQVKMSEIRTDIKYIREALERGEKKFEALGDDIDDLEAYRDKAVGVVAVIGGVTGILGAVITLLLQKFMK